MESHRRHFIKTKYQDKWQMIWDNVWNKNNFEIMWNNIFNILLVKKVKINLRILLICTG